MFKVFDKVKFESNGEEVTGVIKELIELGKYTVAIVNDGEKEYCQTTDRLSLWK